MASQGVSASQGVFASQGVSASTEIMTTPEKTGSWVSAGRFVAAALILVAAVSILAPASVAVDNVRVAAPAKVKPEILVPCLLSQPFLHAMNAFEEKFPGEAVIFMRIKKMGELSEYLSKGDKRPVIFHGDMELEKLETEGKLEKGDRQYLFYMDTPLALLVRSELKDKVKSIKDLVIPEVKKIGFPSPEVHSLGDRVEQIIRREGLYDILKEKIVYIPPDKMIIQYISDPRAEIQVEASIVYSDCILSNMTTGNMPKGIEVVQKWSPGFFNPLPVYIVGGSRAVGPAAKFLEFIRSAEIVAIFALHGYKITLPDQPKGSGDKSVPDEKPGPDECPPCELRDAGADGGKENGNNEIIPPEKKFMKYFDLESQPIYPIEAGAAEATVEVLAIMPPTGCKNDLICGLIELPERFPAVKVILLDMFSREGRVIMKERDINCSTIFINGAFEFEMPGSVGSASSQGATVERVCLKGGPAQYSIEDVVKVLKSLGM